jgi:hypothetical protein
MGRLVRFIGLASVLVVGMACAGEVEEESTSGGGSPSAPSISPVEVSLKPPVLTQIDSFSNVLRLTWETPSTCDEIEGERRTATSPFEVIFTVPGSDSVFVDGEAIEDKTYTYRLRCRRSFSISAYSNEMTANPADG